MTKAFQSVFLRPGTYNLGGRQVTLSADDLAKYAAGTNAALDAGIPIPIFDIHAPAGADDVFYAQFSEDKAPTRGDGASALDCVGWLKKIRVNENGSLSHLIDVSDSEAQRKIDEGSIRFTSPEFRDDYTPGKGDPIGKMFRHFALTPMPRNPDQTNLTAVPEGAQFSLDGAQFSLAQFAEDTDLAKPEVARALLQGLGAWLPDDVSVAFSDSEIDAIIEALGVVERVRKATEAKRKSEESVLVFGEHDEGGNQVIKEGKSGDESAVEAATNKTPANQNNQLMPAVREALAAKGIVIPNEMDPFVDVEAFLNVLLSALATSTATEENMGNKESADKVVVEESKPMGGAQFSEHSDPAVRALASRLDRAEGRLASTDSKEHRRGLRGLPPAIQEKLGTLLDGAQFSEGQEQATVKPSEVVELVRELLPNHMLFDEVEESSDQNANELMGGAGGQTDEEIKAGVDSQLQRTGFGRSNKPQIDYQNKQPVGA